MTATTTERNTQRRDGVLFSFPAAASKCLAGTIAVLNTAGNAEMATTATGKTCVGVFDETVDNTGGSAGGVQVQVRRGVFPFANSASTDAIANTDIGATCYLVDNQTVAKTDGSSARSKAGVVRFVDSYGVWVEF
ncbi:hypothetical protein ACVCL0_09055 [Rhodanobacter sp. UC4450_H17]